MKEPCFHLQKPELRKKKTALQATSAWERTQEGMGEPGRQEVLNTCAGGVHYRDGIRQGPMEQEVLNGLRWSGWELKGEQWVQAQKRVGVYLGARRSKYKWWNWKDKLRLSCKMSQKPSRLKSLGILLQTKGKSRGLMIRVTGWKGSFFKRGFLKTRIGK